jgi:hypothetical protein
MIFDGPRRFVERAKYELINEDAKPSEEVWVKKLKAMYNQRSFYSDMTLYAEECPLYHALLHTYEDTNPLAIKPLLEAYLLTELTYQQISDIFIRVNPIYNPLFIGLYHDLFYNIRPYADHELAMYRYVIQPMLSFDSNKLATEHIWKLLAYRGGAKLLTEVGLGSKPFSPDDVDYLLHLGSMRSVSTMLKYTAQGIQSFGEDAALASSALGVMYQYEAARSLDRDIQGFRAIVDTSATEFSSALTAVFKKVTHKEPSEQQLLSDGKFDVTNKDAIEMCELE